jgi:hypothetical protein
MHQELGERLGIAHALSGLALIAQFQGHLVRAAQLFGAADTLFKVVGGVLPIPPSQRIEFDRVLSVVRNQLGESNWEEAWSQGKSLSLDEAIVLAIKENTTLTS